MTNMIDNEPTMAEKHGNPPVDVQQYGQSIWYDNISRTMITSGELQRLIDESGVVGVTSNPTIFEKAIGSGTAYDAQISTLVGQDPAQIYDQLSITDIRDAADILRPVYDRTNGIDGYISLEVSPLYANNTETTLSEAKRLFATVGRPNLMIKIPGTPAGLPAIEEAIYAGVNINVTLLFSVANHVAVMEAYIRGLERRLAEGKPVDKIASVASFFLSRIDTIIDKQLENNIRAAQGRDIDRVKANGELLGKVAIANAKAAYRRYREIFHGERFAKLRAAGAMVQRPLWASTGTKNPAYPDTLYMDALIGRETVNTVPPATLVAFKDHGTVRPTLEQDIGKALTVLDKLAEVGINLDLVTNQLQEDGVEQFIESFQKLIAGVRGKVRLLRSGIKDRQSFVLGQHQAAVDAAIKQLETDNAPRRIGDRDPSFFDPAADAAGSAAIVDRLGWLKITTDGRIDRAALLALQVEAKAQGWTDAVLLGMGGSSLAPEALARVFGPQAGYPALHVLDSTDPAAISAVEKACDLTKTVFIVASKSGTTVETLSAQRYFYAKYAPGSGGAHFIAITDPGSKLEGWARDLGFAHTFLNPADIGGRYAALSYFGLVPAAIIGLDINRLLDAATEMQKACDPMVAAGAHPGVQLGAILGALGMHGRDKVTLLTNPALEGFGAWAEQLIAESTGKHGKGLIPVVGATIGNPHDYDDDRLLIYLRLDEEAGNPDDAIKALQEAGHPIVTLTLRDRFDIGQEFYRFAYATAIAARILGVNPFDEPNVAESKANTSKLLERYAQNGQLPRPVSIFTERGVSLYADAKTASLLEELYNQRAYNTGTLAGELAAFLGLARSGEYIALMAYTAMTPENTELLENIRRRIRHTFNRAVTLGFGPRFLHSTGQLHKGGPNTGVFLQITVEDKADVPIPQAAFGFATLKQAQAAGDLQALQDHGRRVVRLHLTGDVAAGLRVIDDAVKAAEEKRK